MYSFRGLVLVTLLASLLGACAGNGYSRQDTGTLFGGLLGGLVGHQVDDGAAGVIIGALAGAAIGRMIGRQMDEADRRELARVLETAPSGETRRWRNEDTGYAYAVTPTSALQRDGGRQCRSFKQEVTIDGRPEVIDATACRDGDDRPWQVAS